MIFIFNTNFDNFRHLPDKEVMEQHPFKKENPFLVLLARNRKGYRIQ